MLELRTRPMVGNTQRVAYNSPQARPQSRKLMIALVVLVVALVVLILKDQQFWFSPSQSILDANEPVPGVVSKPVATPAPAVAAPAQTAKASVARKRIAAVATPAEPKPAEAPAVAVNRTVLPPLDVEVIAGDKHNTVRPGSNAARVEIPHPAVAVPVKPEPTITAATNAAEVAPVASAAVRPRAAYPMLAQHMNVQGSVVLQAMIGTDGIIQNLHVLSGPAILTSAAQQAVREWRFKPVLQNGQAVETQAKITVNFNIKVADGTPQDHQATGF